MSVSTSIQRRKRRLFFFSVAQIYDGPTTDGLGGNVPHPSTWLPNVLMAARWKNKKLQKKSLDQKMDDDDDDANSDCVHQGRPFF